MLLFVEDLSRTTAVRHERCAVRERNKAKPKLGIQKLVPTLPVLEVVAAWHGRDCHAWLGEGEEEPCNHYDNGFW